MIIIKILLSIGVSLLFLGIVFIPLEKAFPAKASQKVFRKEWLLDFCFFLGQYLLWNSLVFIGLVYLNNFLIDYMPKIFVTAIANIPFWLQAILVFVLSDLFIYWAHRWQHLNSFLWRFHKVHHSTEHLDWMAAHREHPMDTIYTVGIINLPAMLFGFDLNVLAGIIAFRGIWAIYIHSNVRMPIKWLRWLIGAPELHHWHHDKDRQAGNYANLSPLMDIVFGTYKCPDEEPKHFGINEATPKNYIGQLVEPFMPKRFKRKGFFKNNP